MSSYTTRANGIIVLLYRQTRYFWCCVVKQVPNYIQWYCNTTVYNSKPKGGKFSLLRRQLRGLGPILRVLLTHDKF